ncbi:MAG: hypothetical protein AAGA27_08680, partial [Pseudomonadota bacterium]
MKKFILTDLQKSYYLGELPTAYLSGITPDFLVETEIKCLNIERLESIIDRVIASQEMLRAVVMDENHGLVMSQVPRFKVDVVNSGKNNIDHFFFKEKARNFNLKNFPLFSLLTF